MSNAAIIVDNLSKRYILGHQIRGRSRYVALRDVLANSLASLFRDSGEIDAAHEEFWALKDVSFQIEHGERVGIIGRNGAGKSTLLKILSRITSPTRGRVEIENRVSSLLEVGTGFHPELTGRENIFLNGAILGMKRYEIKKRFDEIVAFAEVEKFLDTPVKHYSSGMYVRLAFAVAAHLEPDILIVDEVLAVGDSQFQKKCMGKMQSVSQQEGRTVLFVSHNMQAIRQMCERVILMKQGKLAYSGDPHTAISSYLGHGADAESLAVYDLSHYPRTMPIEGGRFLKLRFLNDEGRATASLSLTDVLTVEVDFIVRKQMHEFGMSMAVVHGEGLRVFSETYGDQYESLKVDPGEYTVRFHVPMRFFKMESYFLAVTLVDGGRVCDHLEGVLMPEIVNENPDLHRETNRWGVMRIPINWDVIRPTAPSPQAKG